LANPLRSSCNACNATFYNTAMGLIAISFLFHVIVVYDGNNVVAAFS
jgi:hypothetical protein